MNQFSKTRTEERITVRSTLPLVQDVAEPNMPMALVNFVRIVRGTFFVRLSAICSAVATYTISTLFAS